MRSIRHVMAAYRGHRFDRLPCVGSGENAEDFPYAAFLPFALAHPNILFYFGARLRRFALAQPLHETGEKNAESLDLIPTSARAP